MDFNIQLQVTDEELKEFPEKQLIDTTERIAEQSNHQSQSTRLPIHTRQTLIQSSVHSMYVKQELVQLSVHVNQTLIHPRVLNGPIALPRQSLIQPMPSPPSLLTLQPKLNVMALARSLTPQAQRYVCIGIHLSHQISQPGSSA